MTKGTDEETLKKGQKIEKSGKEKMPKKKLTKKAGKSAAAQGENAQRH